MIELRDVSKSYRTFSGRRVAALSDLSLDVRQGEVFGFLGPNGAGKSTTIKILFDLIRPDRGQATIMGESAHDPRVRRQVGYLPENPYFYDYLTADELVRFGAQVSGVDAREWQQRADELFAKMALSEARSRPLRSYSKGMVQRAGLALALIHNPQVVILDEPMSGLDPIGRKMVGDLIMELKAQGKTVFFSSHILTDIERFCDRIAILSGGRLRALGALPELLGTQESLEDFFLRVVALSAEDKSCQ